MRNCTQRAKPLLAGALLFHPIATPALAQPAEPAVQAPPPRLDQQSTPAIAPADADTAESDEEEIEVIGQRDPNAVIGDIPAENQLNPRDIRAYGAATIAELLDAIAPQTASGRGRDAGAPMVLINGRRISGFRELRDLPPEAILRLDILPEEVALKYGARADQRVVNIILRRRYRSTAMRALVELPTEGGRSESELDATRVTIFEGRRTSLNAHVERSTLLTEDERDIALDDADPADTDPRRYRSLLDSRRMARLGGTYGRNLFGNVSATLDGEVQWSDGKSLLGPSRTEAGAPLTRDVSELSARVGTAMTGDVGQWRWSLTGGYDVGRTDTETEREDASPTLRVDDARSVTRNGDIDVLAQGSLFTLPAGKSNIAVRVGGNTRDLESRSERTGAETKTDLGRDRVSSSLNLDLPISRRNGVLSQLGNLSLNANAEVEHLSDFGTLASVGAGAFWSPFQRLNLITSWTREEGAPGLEQLGEPVLATPNTRVFDFVRGETAIVETVSGGNPDLRADTRHVLKIGGSFKPSAKIDFNLRADYISSRIDNPIARFPGASAAIEAAFPERFQRDAGSRLVRVDFRPVNFESASRDEIRWGFTFTKRLRSGGPPASVLERIRRLRSQNGARPGAPPEGLPPHIPQLEDGEVFAMPMRGGAGESVAPPGEGEGDVIAAPSGAHMAREGVGPGGGVFFAGGGPGGPRGSRLQFSLFHTLALKDEARIQQGLPTLDFLDGDVGDGAGRSRHRIQADAGYYHDGLGARLSADWQSGTTVKGSDPGTLRFSPLAKLNLSAFANFGERPIAMDNPWLRGTQLRLSLENIFDAKQRVRDGAGDRPLNYQPDLLDPQGRTIRISLRKLFSPPPRFGRRGM